MNGAVLRAPCFSGVHALGPAACTAPTLRRRHVDRPSHVSLSSPRARAFLCLRISGKQARKQIRNARRAERNKIDDALKAEAAKLAENGGDVEMAA